MLDQSGIIDAGVYALSALDYAIGNILKFQPQGDEASSRMGLVSESRIAEAIEAVCNQQARAYGCLFDNGNRNTESNRLRNLRLERVGIVRDQCKGMSLTYLSNRGIRNALAHYDERYLKLIAVDDNWFRVEWLAFGSKAAIVLDDGRRAIMTGVYFYEEDELHMLGEVLKLVPLRLEIEEALNALGFELDKTSRPDSV